MSIHGKKFGIMLPQREGAMGGETARGGDLLALAAMAEELGFDSVWLVDHFLWHVPELSRYGEPVPRGEEGVRFGFWECWAIASALAAATTHIEIGTLVVNTGYRNPALLARIADTVDELSDGRLILGLGAGAVLGEYEAFGYDYERRVGRFEEALQIIKPMLRGEEVTFEGEFYRTYRAELRPKAARAEGAPILIGLLKGGPRMKRLVAQYADHWNCWLSHGDSSVHVYAESRDEIAAACEKQGRDPATLVKNVAVSVCLPGEEQRFSAAAPIRGTENEIAEKLGQYLDTDVDHVVISMQPNTRDALETLSRVLERLA